MEEVTSIYNLGGVIFYIATLLFLVASLLLIRPYRPVYLTMIAVPLIAGTSYFVMGQEIGFIQREDHLVNVIRYVDWFFTTPLLLFTLAYAMYPKVDERWKSFWMLAVLDITMLATGLAAELTDGNFRTLFFSVSSLAYLFVLYLIIDRLLKLNLILDIKSLRRSVYMLAWIVVGLWSVYPFIWIFGPSGLQILDIIGETNAYLVLDVLTKTGFNIFLLRFLYLEVKSAKSFHGK